MQEKKILNFHFLLDRYLDENKATRILDYPGQFGCENVCRIHLIGCDSLAILVSLLFSPGRKSTAGTSKVKGAFLLLSIHFLFYLTLTTRERRAVSIMTTWSPMTRSRMSVRSCSSLVCMTVRQPCVCMLRGGRTPSKM